MKIFNDLTVSDNLLTKAVNVKQPAGQDHKQPAGAKSNGLT